MVWNLVGGALAVFVLAAAAAAVKWGRRGWAWALTRIRDDHQTLFEPSWTLSSYSLDSRIRLICACAPSRRPNVQALNPDSAIKFLAEMFPGEFPEPAMSLPEYGVRCEKDGMGLAGGYCTVWACGRVDYVYYLENSFDSDGKLTISAVEIMSALARMYALMRSNAYRHLFPVPRFHKRRLDWFVGLGDAIVSSNGINMPWSDLTFPGRQPKRTGNDPQPYCPSGGYAGAALKGWDTSRSPADLTKVALTNMLQTNGYFDTSEAVADVCAVVESLPVATF